MERGALCKRMTEGCAVAPLSRYFSAPAVEQEDAADLPQPHGTLKIWHSGQSIDDREKEYSVRETTQFRKRWFLLRGHVNTV